MENEMKPIPGFPGYFATQIAKQFNVSFGAVYDIVKRRNWAWL